MENGPFGAGSKFGFDVLARGFVLDQQRPSASRSRLNWSSIAELSG